MRRATLAPQRNDRYAGAAPNGAAGLAAWLMTCVHLLAILDACSDFWIETETPGEAPQAARPMVRPCL